MTEFFINRPVFAIVFNFLIVMVGVLAYRNLSVSEYPIVSIPTISVTAPYPNASAEMVESDITPLLEEQLAGAEGLENIQSSSSTGVARITLTFRPDTSMEQALAQVRDRVGRARTLWPKDAKEPLIEQQGNQSQPIIWMSVTSGQHGFAELTHFARLYIKNQLQTIPGVSSVLVLGPPYTMDVSLNRLSMFAHQVGPNDVLTALANKKASFPAGRYHGETAITLKFPLEEPEDFESTVIKKTKGSLVTLGDIGAASLGFNENLIARIDGKGAIFLGIIKAPDGNPLAISKSLKDLLPSLEQTLPAGVKLHVEYNVATFIRASLNSIQASILEAGALVLLIIFLFLRNLRSTLIPLLTIPISLIGTLAFISAFGFSINTISLLAMVLAVGLVVDDAIVVLENIHRHIEKGLSPLEAAKKGSREIAFAIIAMTLTLASVYAPIAFISGIIGQLFIEFALTLAAAVVVSGVVALTLSPMMCSRLLKAKHKELFPIVDVWIAGLNRNYRRALARVLTFPKSVFLFALVVAAGGAALFVIVPSELAPKEDRGFIGAFIEPLPGKPVTTLLPYATKVEDVFRARKEVDKTLTFTEGDSLIIVAPLKDWAERDLHSVSVVEEMREKLAAIPAINAFGWNWDTNLPGIDLGQRGASVAVTVRTTGDYKELAGVLDELQVSAEKDKVLEEIWHDMHMDFPGLRANPNERKMAMLEVSPQEVAKALETSFDKSSTLEFLKDGLRYDVRLYANRLPDDLSEVFVTNARGTPIPLSAVVDLESVALPAALNHTRQLRSATFGAQLAKGLSLGQAIKYIDDKMKATLPSHFSYELTGAAQRQQESANVMLLLFATALLFIYCVLAIQFESFVDPLIILVTVPLASCGALFFMWMLGQSLNIFSQIGLITLVGLITKHGILIVDFANHRLEAGLSTVDAILEAASQRLRPVLMTTGAMVFGSIPLMIASGAGSEARRAIGSVLVGGLIFGTLLTLFVIPVFYSFVKSHTPQKIAE